MTLKAMAESMYADGQDENAERTWRRARTLLLSLGNDVEAAAVSKIHDDPFSQKPLRGERR